MSTKNPNPRMFTFTSYLCVSLVCAQVYMHTKITKNKKKTKEIKYGNTVNPSTSDKINVSECNRQIWKI